MKRQSDIEPKLTLVGAGPGDPELITLKAIRAIELAGVVLYDALVSPEILALIPKGIPSFSVGKRSGEHSFPQEKINELIVSFARQYGNVVRLKGGDPFVFGRGTEEIEFAEEHGISTAVVPGISSAIAAPASIKIPVTARGVSESVWIITGTTQSGTISHDIALASQSSATLVILMGLNKIEEIMNTLKRHNKGAVPVAVIQNGTLSSERVAIGTVSTIVAEVKREGIGSPAIIVVGDVVRYAEPLHHVVSSLQSIA
jgi:uroporphyrin-III C-methyltransferase